MEDDDAFLACSKRSSTSSNTSSDTIAAEEVGSRTSSVECLISEVLTGQREPVVSFGVCPRHHMPFHTLVESLEQIVTRAATAAFATASASGSATTSATASAAAAPVVPAPAAAGASVPTASAASAFASAAWGSAAVRAVAAHDSAPPTASPSTLASSREAATLASAFNHGNTKYNNGSIGREEEEVRTHVNQQYNLTQRGGGIYIQEVWPSSIYSDTGEEDSWKQQLQSELLRFLSSHVALRASARVLMLMRPEAWFPFDGSSSFKKTSNSNSRRGDGVLSSAQNNISEKAEKKYDWGRGKQNYGEPYAATHGDDAAATAAALVDALYEASGMDEGDSGATTETSGSSEDDADFECTDTAEDRAMMTRRHRERQAPTKDHVANSSMQFSPQKHKKAAHRSKHHRVKESEHVIGMLQWLQDALKLQKQLCGVVATPIASRSRGHSMASEYERDTQSLQTCSSFSPALVIGVCAHQLPNTSIYRKVFEPLFPLSPPLCSFFPTKNELADLPVSQQQIVTDLHCLMQHHPKQLRDAATGALMAYADSPFSVDEEEELLAIVEEYEERFVGQEQIGDWASEDIKQQIQSPQQWRDNPTDSRPVSALAAAQSHSDAVLYARTANTQHDKETSQKQLTANMHSSKRRGEKQRSPFTVHDEHPAMWGQYEEGRQLLQAERKEEDTYREEKEGQEDKEEEQRPRGEASINCQISFPTNVHAYSTLLSWEEKQLVNTWKRLCTYNWQPRRKTNKNVWRDISRTQIRSRGSPSRKRVVGNDCRRKACNERQHTFARAFGASPVPAAKEGYCTGEEFFVTAFGRHTMRVRSREKHSHGVTDYSTGDPHCLAVVTSTKESFAAATDCTTSSEGKSLKTATITTKEISASVTGSVALTDSAAFTDSACITDNAVITDSAAITNSAAITDCAAVTDSACISDTAAITDSAANAGTGGVTDSGAPKGNLLRDATTEEDCGAVVDFPAYERNFDRAAPTREDKKSAAVTNSAFEGVIDFFHSGSTSRCRMEIPRCGECQHPPGVGSTTLYVAADSEKEISVSELSSGLIASAAGRRDSATSSCSTLLTSFSDICGERSFLFSSW